jgi:hypothetical protein
LEHFYWNIFTAEHDGQWRLRLMEAIYKNKSWRKQSRESGVGLKEDTQSGRGDEEALGNRRHC